MHFVFLGITSFSQLPQREHALAFTLAQRGIKVTFIENMPSLASKLRKIFQHIMSPLSLEKMAKSKITSNAILVLTPPTVPTFTLSSWTPLIDQIIFKKWFANIHPKIDWSQTILFVSVPHWWTGFIDRKIISPALIIYDKNDSLLVPSRTKKAFNVMQEAEYKLIKDSDIISYSANEMKNELEKMNQNKSLLLLPNAVSNDFIESASKRVIKKNMTVGFIGAIDERWIDVPLICSAANAFPNIIFKIIGPVSRKVKLILSKCQNIHLLGSIPHIQVVEILKTFDVSLIPFLFNEITRVVNPLKLYEYCAAGIPIVAIKTQELNLYREILYLAETRDEFILCIEKALEENDETKQRQRIEFAKNNTWDRRVDNLLEFINRDF